MGYSSTHYKSINPYTEEVVYETAMHSRDEAIDILERSNQAYERTWSKTDFAERARLLNAVAQEMKDNLDEYALSMTEEMGKPINEARGEVGKAAWAAEHYAKYAEQYLEKEFLPSDATSSYVQYLSLGVTVGILPGMRRSGSRFAISPLL